MSPVSKTELFKSVPLIIAVLVVAVGAYIVGHNATAQMVQASAQTSARNWADFIVQHAPQIDRVLEGAAPVELAAPFIRAMERSGSIKQYRIYDQFGAVRVDSTQRVWSLIAPGNQVRRNARAFDVLATNNAYFEFSDGISDGVKKLYARSFATMVKDGRTIGVIEVLSDETVNWNVLRGQLRVAGLQIIGLIVLAFVLPGMMYLRKSGQFEFAARRLKHTSKYDDLTGALNRSAFTVMIKDQIKSAGASSMSIAVHFIDMDRFKDVNDSRGHSVGDELLAQTGARLQKLLGIRESLARLGGDEFAICQPYFHNTPEAVRALADDVVREMAKPFNINGEDLQIGASVGYSHYPSDGETVAELFRTADVALYRAKDIKRGGALAFDQSMEAERKARQQIEVRLRSALANNEFEINYQPYFSADGTVLRGFEALLRLNDDNGKSISPAVFIPIAEDMGLIGEIGNWVLVAAARTACEWPDDLTVSVNLSPAQFQTHSMPKMVEECLRGTGLPASRLELEITESLLITETDKVLGELRAIKDLGVSIALDDFGTGYSSLAYLWQFPFDKLKVDKSFMTDLTVTGGKSREILATIIALGRVMGMRITAEGVETEGQALILRELDCDFIQGFLYGRPANLADLPGILLATAQQKLQVGKAESASLKRMSA